jgi:hypothetical protein
VGTLGHESGPVLRTVALSASDKFKFDQLELEYGFSAESISYLRRLTYVSPFARANYDLGKQGAVRVAFTSGLQPSEQTRACPCTCTFHSLPNIVELTLARVSVR